MNKFVTRLPFFFALLSIGLLAACSRTVPPSSEVKIGKPYVIDGKTYYPEYDADYDKVGMASWYGPGFHGKYTASGETFNQNDLTAAHPTLPMPSLVRVTNISSGKSAIVRINDRGPFAHSRIIDLSKRSAEELGIKGVAKVRVQYLPRETEAYLTALRGGDKSGSDLAQINQREENRKNNTMLASTEPVQAAPVDAVESVGVEPPAPVVASSDLPPPESKPVTLAAAPVKKSGGGFLVKQAWADDEVPAKSEAMPTAKPEVKPTAKTETAPAKVASTPPTGSDYYIQVGSFGVEENAKKIAASTAAAGKSEIGKVEMGAKTWWRVRMGPFANAYDAETALAKVRTLGAPDARLIHQ